MVSVSFILLAGLQYISFFFSPYPLAAPPGLSQASNLLGMKLHSSTFAKDGQKDNPVPYRDWGYDWAIKNVERFNKGQPVYLNVLVNEPDLNAQTFDLETRERKLALKPTTSLIWTIVGDELKFSEETAMYYHWYLVKEGKLPRFKGEDSKTNYSKLVAFIKDSGHFQYVDRMKAPDGDSLVLYRMVR